MAQPPSFHSNNPFRRKASVPSAPAAPPAAVPRFADVDDEPSPSPGNAPAPASADLFRTQLQALSTADQPPPATSFQKPKVVKKVRVQSPPSSPEYPEPSGRFPPPSLDDGEGSNSDETDELADPFSYASSTGSAVSLGGGDELQTAQTHGPPGNPFQKTLRDLEGGLGNTEPEQSSVTAPGTKGSLDMGAFGRLLLTGQAGSSGSGQAGTPYTQQDSYTPIPSGDGAGAADFTSRSSSVLEALPVTPQTSREASEQDTEDDRRGLVSSSQSSLQPAPTIKKKPPPPSSRHGKLIKPGAGEAKAGAGGAPPPLSSPARKAATLPLASPSRHRPPTPSDVNKPLPPAPVRSPADERVESVFDREAAGKLPEPVIQPRLNIVMPLRPPTPPNASHAVLGGPASTPQPAKKPIPPPRRQPHGRSESKVNSSPASGILHDDIDSPLRRSSVDSTRSRSSSLRVSLHAPAPPPPRRPSHQSRASSLHSLPPVNASPGDAEPSPLSNTIVPSPPPIGGNPNSSSSNTPGITTPLPPPALAATVTSSAAHYTSTPNANSHHPSPATATSTSTAKLAPPPPPPARNASVRGKRPISSTGTSELARRVSGGGNRGKEPPPPPRHRDSNRGSRRGSVDDLGGSGAGGAGVAAGSEVGGGGGSATQLPMFSPPAVAVDIGDSVVGGSDAAPEMAVAAESYAGDILADLTALQREVDALRGRVEQG